MAPLDSVFSAALRDAGGRFQPGRSGNPRGRPPGSLNRATRLRAWLDDGEERSNARIVIDRALGGDHVAARHLMDRLDPKPRTRPLPLVLGDDIEIDSTYEAAFHLMATGEIAPDEAIAVGRFLDQLRAHRAKSDAAAAQAADDAQLAAARAARTAALERQNDLLRRENAGLSARLAALESAAALPPAPAPALADDQYSACIIRPASQDAAPPAEAPVTPLAETPVAMSPPAPAPVPTSAPAPSPADDLYSASIIRSPAPPDLAPPPPASQPIPAAPMRRRKSAMRYWAGQPAPGIAYAGERIRGVQERRYDSTRGIRSV
jgi:hypothetical protein